MMPLRVAMKSVMKRSSRRPRARLPKETPRHAADEGQRQIEHDEEGVGGRAEGHEEQAYA